MARHVGRSVKTQAYKVVVIQTKVHNDGLQLLFEACPREVIDICHHDEQFLGGHLLASKVDVPQ